MYYKPISKLFIDILHCCICLLRIKFFYFIVFCVDFVLFVCLTVELFDL